MSLSSFVKTPKRIYRLSQIMQVLVKHGFGYLVYNLRLHTYLPLINRFHDLAPKSDAIGDGGIASRIREVCQELGPTFVKLGQVLSTRPDIIPDDFIKELQYLQSGVKPFDFNVSKSIIEGDLKVKINDIFLTFEDEPIASGSIGQVHSATLLNGTEVVVKVKRPDIESVITNDLSILTYIAEQAEKIEEFKIYRPLLIVNEFARKIERELDLISEASSTSRFYGAFNDDPNVKIPKVYWEYSTHNVLTLERIEFVALTGNHKLETMGIDMKKLASNLMTTFMSQYFEKNIFHADPHPGNLMVSDTGTIALIDFGMVGYVSDELKKQLGGAVIAMLKNDFDLFVDIFMDMGITSADCDLYSLRLSLFEVVDKYSGIPFSNIDTGKAFSDVMGVAREHDMILPRDFIMLTKSFVTITSITRSLYPAFNFLEVVTGFAENQFRDRYSPGSFAKTATSNTWHLTNLLKNTPKELRYILRKILGGNMQLVLKHKGLENLITDLDKSSNRLALSIILAATVIGSSIIMMGKIGPLFLGNISILGTIGYSLATVMGFSLVVAIFRSGRL